MWSTVLVMNAVGGANGLERGLLLEVEPALGAQVFELPGALHAVWAFRPLNAS